MIRNIRKEQLEKMSLVQCNCNSTAHNRPRVSFQKKMADKALTLEFLPVFPPLIIISICATPTYTFIHFPFHFPMTHTSTCTHMGCWWTQLPAVLDMIPYCLLQEMMF